MKILILCELASIHSARWINQLKNTGWEIHISQSASQFFGFNDELKFGIIHLPITYSVLTKLSIKEYSKIDSNKKIILFVILKFFAQILRLLPGRVKKIIDNILFIQYLTKLIEGLKPDLIHSLGLNVNWINRCLPVVKAKKRLKQKFNIPWIYSTWGSDLDYYAKMSPEHLEEVKSVLRECDYLTTECQRDFRLATEMDFNGNYLGFFPDYGGVNLEEITKYSSSKKTSHRKIILLKGRDSGDGGDPVGRAITAIKAFLLCKDILKGYKIVISQASSSVINAVHDIVKYTNLEIEILKYISYENLLQITGDSRIFIALTINDGLPSALIESMALGVFPIHSDLEPIREWIKNGENGFLVPAENPMAVAEALTKALEDDELVNNASLINKNLIKKYLSDDIIKARVIEMYETIAKNK